MKLINTSLFAALPLLLLAAPAAHAQFNFALTPSQTGMVGDTLTFTGAIANQGNSAVFLNGGGVTFSAPNIMADDSPFFGSAPLSLAPAGSLGSAYSGPFFTLAIGPAAQPGTYFGTFGIVGGADALASDTLATRNFSVTVSSAPTVPEASPAVSLGLMLALGAGGVLAARRKSAKTGA